MSKIKDWIYNKFFKDEYGFAPLEPIDVPKIKITNLDIQKLATFVPLTQEIETIIHKESDENVKKLVFGLVFNNLQEYIKPYIKIEYINNISQTGFYGTLEVVNRHDE